MVEFFLKERVLSIHDLYHIYDREGRECFQIKSKAVSVHNYTCLMDMEGNELAKVHKKLLSLHEIHYIEMDGQEVTEVRSELNPIHQKIDAPGFGWQIRGNIFQFNFSVVDQNDGRTVMAVHRRVISIGEGYQVIIDRDEDVIRALALMVALERILTDRKDTITEGNDHTARNNR